MPPLSFQIEGRDAGSAARLGTMHTPHGAVETPAFMAVGTKATVKGLTVEQVAQTGTRVVLGNTYHLMVRPGAEQVAKFGGLHRFSGWDGPMLTDSGGYQVFSLADASTIGEDGVRFRNDVDGGIVDMTPEASIRAQNRIGADIIMAFDDCPPMPADRVEPMSSGVSRAVDPADYAARNRLAAERTVRWLERCVDAHERARDQALFGIVQGGSDLDLRTHCAKAIVAMGLPGHAIGGVSVGESHEQIVRVVRHTAALLPEDRPRYLMGVGYERDIVQAVRAGVDLFDCVLPTRNGRNAKAFTPTGPVNLRNAVHAEDSGPIDPGCDCLACTRHSRAYLRHLFGVKEMLGPVLVSLHNLRHFQRLMLDIRRAIRDDAWPLLASRWPVTQA